MKNIFKDFFSQCARPEGFLGRCMLRFMNFGHAPLTNWGLTHITFSGGMIMLDIGCGGGATLKRLLKRCPNGKVYGIDISEESVSKARNVNKRLLGSQVFVEQGSADNLPWENRKFDVVTAVETVYFWPNLPQCFQEVKRVLKPGGQFAIMLEVIEGDSVWTNVVEGMTVYSPEQLKDMLEKAGFSQVEVFKKKPSYATIKGILKYEEPNSNMNSFNGRLKLESFPRASDVNLDNFVMRGATMKNVRYESSNLAAMEMVKNLSSKLPDIFNLKNIIPYFVDNLERKSFTTKLISVNYIFEILYN